MQNRPFQKPFKVLCLLAALCWPRLATPAFALGEGVELEVGGPGSEVGQFWELRDITLDLDNNLYTLEGARVDSKTKALSGNLRVQKFSAAGVPLSQISLRDEALGEKNDPQRLAVGLGGDIFVTIPAASLVKQFGDNGKLKRTFAVPDALAITRTNIGNKERIAVTGSHWGAVDGKGAWIGGDKIYLLDDDLVAPIALAQPMQNVSDMTADGNGNLYVLAATNQIYVFDATGKLQRTIGSSMNTRNADGSEPLHSVAVDSHGNIYTMTWGNPGLVTRYDADGRMVTQREGQWQWADPFSTHSSYVPLAVDRDDRLWLASTLQHDPAGPNFSKYHPVPAVVRLGSKYFDLSQNGVTQRNAKLMGFVASLQCALPYSISYAPKQPVAMQFSVAPANRQLQSATLRWHAQDAWGKSIARGECGLSLHDGQEVKQSFSFVPPRFGWYETVAEVWDGNERLQALGAHVGVTPKFAGMETLEPDESKGGWEDAPRQMFCGLPNMRLHTGKGLDKLDADLALAQKYGATVFVQMSDAKDCTPDKVREAVSRFKGRVPVWEVMNEPNFSMKPEEYVALLKSARAVIKEIDPAAQVMGPTICGIQLDWYQKFYEAGGGPLVDILSLHDYEGHESIDENHWRWKFAQLRALMAKFGDAQKPIWQTERAITGVRGNNFLGLSQAIRTGLQRDLLETLGVPPEHNNHYYLNEGGYGPVPTYVWSRSGPHPAALLLRTRHALTHGLKYLGTIDFGPTGNTIFMGLHYQNAAGEVYLLRNLGTAEREVEIGVSGGGPVEVVDAWGNVQSLSIRSGKVLLPVGQLPLYLRLNAGRKATFARVDFGRNVAHEASFGYSGKSASDFQLLNNGVLENFHAGHPDGGTDGKKIWTGDLSDNGTAIQQETLELSFTQPKKISHMIVRGVRADNGFCTLLDYDVEVWDGKAWQQIDRVRTSLTPTEAVQTAGSDANTWYGDTNFWIHSWKARTVQRLRIKVLRVTRGFVPDEKSKAWGKGIEPKLMLREIELFEEK